MFLFRKTVFIETFTASGAINLTQQTLMDNSVIWQIFWVGNVAFLCPPRPSGKMNNIQSWSENINIYQRKGRELLHNHNIKN